MMKRKAETIMETVQGMDAMTLKRKRSNGLKKFSLLLAMVCTFAVLAALMPQTGYAWPGKTTSCTSCHGTADTTNATITTAVDGVVGTTATVAPGGSFEIDWRFTNLTPAGETVGIQIAFPTGWTVSAGTANSPAIPGWNTNWDIAGSNGAGTSDYFAPGGKVPWSTASQYPNSPEGQSIDYTNGGWGPGGNTAAYDDTTNPGLDGVANDMGADATISVPGGETPGTYFIEVQGIGHVDGGSTKGFISQTITVTVSGGGNSAPNVPTNPEQYQSDGTTVISVGGWANNTNVRFEGDLSDPDGADTVKLQIDFNGDNTSDCESALVANGSTNVQVSGCTMVDGNSYDWQYRAVDNSGAFSAWTAFNAASPDYSVDTTPAVDGSLTPTPGNTQIDLSWTAATDAQSGLSSPAYKVVRADSTTTPPADCSGAAVYTGDLTSYSDTGLTNGLDYAYRVCAINGAGAFSTGATATAQPSAGCAPVAPTLTIDTNNQQITAGGGNVVYNISITNNDNVACSDTSFNLVINDSNATDFNTSAFGTDPTPLIAPGGTYNTNITVSAVASPTNGATNDTSFTIVNDGSHGTPASNQVTTLINTARTATMHYNVGETIHFEYQTNTQFPNNGTNAFTIFDSTAATIIGPVSMLEVQSGAQWIYTYDWDTTGQPADHLQVQLNNGGTNILVSSVILDNPTATINLYADAGYTTPTNIFANLDTVYVEVILPSAESAISSSDVSNWYSGSGFIPTNNVTQTGTNFRFDFTVDFAAATIPDGDWGWFYWLGQDTARDFHVPIQRNDAGCGTCTYSTPTVSIVTGNQNITTEAGSVNYTINVTNNDTVACGSTGFDLVLSDTDATAFNASTFGVDPLTVAPGVTGSTDITVSSQAGFYSGSNDTYFYTALDGNHAQSLNSNTVTTSLNVPDVTAPTVAITAPTNGSTINGAAAEPIAVTGTASDDRGTVTSVDVSIDGGAWNPASTSDGYANWNWNWSGAADGTYTIDARASDGSNTGNATQFSVTVDRTDPTTTDNAVASWTISDRTVTLTPDDGTGTGIASTQYCVDGTNTCDPNAGTTYSVPFSITQSAGQEGLQYLRYFSTDNAGNTETTVSKTIRIDKLAPTDGAPLNLTPGNGQITVAWNAASDLGSGLDTTNPYKVVRADGTTTPPVDCSGAAVYQGNLTSYNDTGLTNGVDYAYRVCSYDAVTNVSSGLTGTTQPAAACVRSTPSVSLGANQDITADLGTADYTITVTNNDSGGCSAQTFDVKTVTDVGAGFTLSFPNGTTTGSIGVGGNDTSLIARVTANASTLNGATHTAGVSTDGTGDPNHVDSAEAQVTTTMNVPCNVAPTASFLTANQQVTTDGGSAAYTVQVQNDNAEACGSTDFDLVAVDDNGVAFSTPSVFTADPLTVAANGGTNTTTLTVTSQVGATNGAVNNTYFYTAVNGSIPQSGNSATRTTTINRPCTRNAPSFNHAVNQNISLDGTAVYTLTIINNDVDCPDTTFNLTVNSEVESNTAAFDEVTSDLSTTSVVVASGATSTTVTYSAVATGSGVEDDTLTTTITLSDATNHAGQDQTTIPVTTLKNINPLLHNSLTTASSKHSGDGGWGVLGGKYGEFTCGVCHVSGSSNAKRIRTTLPNAPDTSKGDFPGAGGTITFLDATEPTTDFGDDSDAPRASSTRVCEVCHTYDVTKAAGVNKHAFDQPSDSAHENAKDCISCHKHSAGFSAGGSSCDSCHAYPPDPADGKTAQAVEGKGAHVKHVNHLAALAGVTLDPNADSYGDVNVTAVCGVCHDMNGATHEMGGGAGANRIINFNSSTAFQFGSSASAYNGVEDVGSATTPKTCSNISCHFQDTPWWE